MSNETNNEDSLEKLEQSMKKLDAIKNDIVSSQLQQLSDTMQKINDSVSAIQSDVMKAVIDLGNRIAELVSSIDFSSILNQCYEIMEPLQEVTALVEYIDLLERLKWPVFLIDDDALRQDILTACADREDEEAVREIIFLYCSDDFLKAMEDDWNSCEAISAERKPILSEAMLMHKQGYYYASTSMLMCQVYGVASDIVNLAKKNGLEIYDDEKDFVAEYFEIKRADIDHEKGRLLQMTVMTESGMVLWNAMARYLQSEILCSSESEKRWATQPLRNKICHGDQLNFGTKEHSLKAILTIDMLIQLAYEIERIIEIHKDHKTTEGIGTDEQQVD